MGRPPSQSQDKFIIRLPDGMRQKIKEAADANGRSMTAEIVWRLELSLDPNVKALPAEQIHDMILGDHNVTLVDLETRLQKVEDHLGFGAKSQRKRS